MTFDEGGPAAPPAGVMDLSVRNLRAALVRSGEGRVHTVEVHLALRCLFHHCPERRPLARFWDAAAQEDDIGRAQGVTAAFNGVVRQLRRSRRFPETNA